MAGYIQSVAARAAGQFRAGRNPEILQLGAFDRHATTIYPRLYQKNKSGGTPPLLA